MATKKNEVYKPKVKKPTPTRYSMCPYCEGLMHEDQVANCYYFFCMDCTHASQERELTAREHKKYNPASRKKFVGIYKGQQNPRTEYKIYYGEVAQ